MRLSAEDLMHHPWFAEMERREHGEEEWVKDEKSEEKGEEKMIKEEKEEEKIWKEEIF